MSVAVLLLAAVAALGLEVTGARPGARKRVQRLPQVVVVVVAAAAAAWLAPTPASIAVAGALIVFALAEGTSLLGERAALALVSAAGTLKLGATTSPAALVAWIALWSVATAGLSMRVPPATVRFGGVPAPESGASGAEAEAATKAALLGVMGVLLVGLGIVVDAQAQAAGACLLCAVALVIGVPPLQGIRVDIFQGAPSAAMTVSAPLALVALGPVLARLVGQQPTVAVDVAIGLGLLGLPLVALAQVSVRRLAGVLVAQQAILPLVAGRLGVDPLPATLAAALGALALSIAVAALPVFSSATATWEDASGWGRRHPWRSGLLVFAASQACGLPPTLGFAVRQELARAAHSLWLTGALMVGIALSALPVVRLALFLFAKQPRPGPTTKLTVGPLLALGVVVAIAVVAGVLHPWLFAPAGPFTLLPRP